MSKLEIFLLYVISKNARLIPILINDVNYRKKAGWRLTTSQDFDYDLLNPEYPADRIATDAKLEHFQKSLYILDKIKSGAAYYVVDKDKGLIPYENLTQAIEGSIGMEKFLKNYLWPIFQGNTEWLEDFEEALEFLEAHLIED